MSKKTHSALFSIIYVAADIAAVAAAFLTAYYIRFSSNLIAFDHVPRFESYLKAMMVAIPIFLFLFRNFKLYSMRPTRRWDALVRSFYAVTFGFIIFMALTFIYRQEHFFYSRLFIFLSWFLIMFYFNVLRFIVNKAERGYVKARRLETKIVILGINKTSRRLIHWLRQARYSGYRVRGIYSLMGDEKGMHIEHCEILGSIKNFARDLEKLDVDEVVLTEPELPREETAKLMLLCESRMIGFKMVADLYGMVTSSVEVEQIDSVSLLGLKPLPLDDLWNRILKRIFDLAVSLAALILTSPLLLFVSILIKLEDGGGILYAQERVGKGGKIFKLLKFRTMIPDAEKDTGPVWAKQGDERKTRIGKILRKTNIDEFPQLWNVFVGEMSLVGPRPERPFFVERFKDEIPRYMARHKIKAGITGWAQVHGYRGEATVQYTGVQKTKMGLPDYTPYQYKEELQFLVERVQLDLYYVENWTPFFDLEILLKTFFAFKNAF